MIVHKNIGMKKIIISILRPLYDFKKSLPIFIRKKDVFSSTLSFISTTGDVVKGIRITYAELPCHDFVIITRCSNHKALF